MQIATRGTRLTPARSPFPRFSSFLFLYRARSLVKIRKCLVFSRATHRDNIDIPLIDISIPNVNTDTPNAYACVCTPVVSATQVSRMYRKKVYERRGGVDITHADCVCGTMTVLNGFKCANNMSARFCRSPIEPVPFHTRDSPDGFNYLLTIVLHQLRWKLQRDCEMYRGANQWCCDDKRR